MHAPKHTRECSIVARGIQKAERACLALVVTVTRSSDGDWMALFSFRPLDALGAFNSLFFLLIVCLVIYGAVCYNILSRPLFQTWARILNKRWFPSPRGAIIHLFKLQFRLSSQERKE